MNPRERLADLAYGTGWAAVRRMPEPVARGLFRAAADLAAKRNGPGVRQLRRNYARVVPQAGPAELDALVRDGLRSYARYWMEAFRLPGMDHRAIVERMDEVFVGRRLIDAALDRGRGLVLVLPHTGNVDVAGLWLVAHHGGFTTVAERLKPEAVYQRFLSFRQSLGFEVLPTDGAAYRTLMERLRANRIVCLPADRDLSRRGVPVTFFGEETRMPPGPARLAAATGAQILVVDNHFTDDGWGVRVHTPIQVHAREEATSATQRIADAFAADIAANPVDWHMMQKLWLADLDDEDRGAPAGGSARGTTGRNTGVPAEEPQESR